MKILPNTKRPYIGMQFKWINYTGEPDKIFKLTGSDVDNVGKIWYNSDLTSNGSKCYFRDEDIRRFIENNELRFV